MKVNIWRLIVVCLLVGHGSLCAATYTYNTGIGVESDTSWFWDTTATEWSIAGPKSAFNTAWRSAGDSVAVFDFCRIESEKHISTQVRLDTNVIASEVVVCNSSGDALAERAYATLVLDGNPGTVLNVSKFTTLTKENFDLSLHIKLDNIKLTHGKINVAGHGGVVRFRLASKDNAQPFQGEFVTPDDSDGCLAFEGDAAAILSKDVSFSLNERCVDIAIGNNESVEIGNLSNASPEGKGFKIHIIGNPNYEEERFFSIWATKDSVIGGSLDARHDSKVVFTKNGPGACVFKVYNNGGGWETFSGFARVVVNEGLLAVEKMTMAEYYYVSNPYAGEIRINAGASFRVGGEAKGPCIIAPTTYTFQISGVKGNDEKLRCGVLDRNTASEYDFYGAIGLLPDTHAVAATGITTWQIVKWAGGGNFLPLTVTMGEGSRQVPLVLEGTVWRGTYAGKKWTFDAAAGTVSAE